MQFGKLGKLVVAGTMGALMVGSTVAFAQLQNYPAPFVQNGNADTLIVVGKIAQPGDVVGAIDVAARLGGERTTNVDVAGTTAGLSISGEGKEVATSNTKIFLGNSLGKTGLRSTMTKDDLPTLLANGVLDDADAGTTHNYQQFIYVTPSDTTSSLFKLEFEKPGSSSSVDPTYDFGRFPSSPNATNYFYRTYVTFDKDVNGSTSVGESIKLFGNTYTIASGTSTAFIGTTADKLVLYGGAQTQVISGGETVTASVGGTDFVVTLQGTSDSTHAVVKVGSDTSSITKGSSKKVGGLDVYVDDIYYLSQNDQTQNSAKLLLGSQKVTLTHGSKVKVGDTDDSVEGTYVGLTASGDGKLSAFNIYIGGKSSDIDYLKAGGTYSDPVWKSFNLAFPNVSPATTADSRDTISVKASGDNTMQVTFTDDKGNSHTTEWAHKDGAQQTYLWAADSSNNTIVVVENTAIVRDQYFVIDGGDFPHLFKLSGTSISGDSSSNIEITDQFSGVTTKVTLGSTNKNSKVIDGQTYFFNTTATDTVYVTWGTSAADHTVGTFHTVFPMLKGHNGEHMAFVSGGLSTAIPVTNTIQLPTGAITLTSAGGGEYTIAAVSKEDGTASVRGGNTTINITALDQKAFSLGKTATGPLWYSIKGAASTTVKFGVIGSAVNADGAPLGNASLVLVEEKDDNGEQYSVVFAASIESSGSNQLAIPATPDFTYAEQSASLGSDSTITDYVDGWGTYVKKATSGQDTLIVYYPDDQVVANVAVLTNDATVGTSGATTSTSVRTPVPIKTSIAKLDTEVTSSDKSTKNFILVGGPVVNMLVGELATAGKTRDTNFYVSQGMGYALVDYVANAFTSGKAALVVAGNSEADTRTVTTKLQAFDTAGLTGARMEWKNGVIATIPA